MDIHKPFKEYYCRPVRCQLLLKGRRSAGLLMAIPFVLCFSLFGIFNLIGGTVLTMMACRPRFPPQTLILIQRIFKQNNKELETFLDPLRVVGTILLVTGSFLVIVGIVLGLVACRSINVHRKNSGTSLSGIQISSINGPNSSQTSSVVQTSFISWRQGGADRKKSHFVADPGSTIYEVNSDEEQTKNSTSSSRRNSQDGPQGLTKGPESSAMEDQDRAYNEHTSPVLIKPAHEELNLDLIPNDALSKDHN